MKTLLTVGARLFWGPVAGTHEEDEDEEKEFSGLLEESE